MHKPSILIDFDKTITPVHGFHEPPVPGAVACINKLKAHFKIIIFSCRANVEVCNEVELMEMCDYLRKYDIYYDDILCDKPLFAAIIDDRAFNPNHVGWDLITKELLDSQTAKIKTEDQSICYSGGL